MSAQGSVELPASEEADRARRAGKLSQAVNPTTVLIAATLTALIVEMQALAVGPLTPTLVGSLRITAAQASWAFLAPSIMGIATLGLLTRVGDMIGHRKVLLGVVTMQCIANVITAVSWNFASLTVGRALVGFTASQALTMAIMRDRISLRDQERGVGLVSGIQGVGIPFGFMIGGIFIAIGASWHWAFWFAAALNLAAMILVFFGMPESKLRAQVKLDSLGALGLGLWLALLVTAVSQSSSWGRTSDRTLGVLAGAIVVFALWVWHERRHAEPLVPIALVSSRRLFPCLAVGTSMAYASITCYFGVTEFAEIPKSVGGYGFGATVLGAGALLIPIGIGQGFMGAYVGRVVTRIGARRVMVFGMALDIVIFMVWAYWHSSIWSFLVLEPLNLLTTMPTFAAGLLVAVTLAPRGSVGIVGGVNVMFTSFGSTLAVAVLTALTTSHLVTGTQVSVESGFRNVFIGGAIACAVGAAIALFIPKTVGRNAFAADVPPELETELGLDVPTGVNAPLG